MRWRTKSTIQRLLSAAPGGTRLNSLFQRALRRSLRIDERSFLFRARLAVSFARMAAEALPRPVATWRAYEFGAGSDLVGPLTLHGAGLDAQVVVDRDPLLQPALVRDAVEKLGRYAADLGLSRTPGLAARGSRRDLVEELRRQTGIDYRAPADAARSGLPDRSIDLITSNSTLEHVPRTDLPPLLAECARVLADDGVMCHRIDYEDHWAIDDPRIPGYHFLRFPEDEWARYNSPLQYQNRLRHPEYLDLFREAGFEVVRQERIEPSSEARAALARFPVDPAFERFSLEHLGTRKGTFLLRKRRPSRPATA